MAHLRMQVLFVLRRANVHTGTQTKAAHYQHCLSSACDVGMMCGTCFHLTGEWFRAPLSEFNAILRPGISLAYERLKIAEPEPAFVYEQSYSLIV